MEGSTRVVLRSSVALLVSLALAASGCDGSGDVPHVDLDSGAGGDGGGGGGGDGGGADDAGMVDPCAGLTLAGTCAGDVARWCEDGLARELDCAASDQVCGDVGGRMRCTAPPPEECSNPIEQEQLRITNLERMRNGIGPLVCDPDLTRAARLHSQDMCDQRYFSHDSLDGRTFRDRIDAQGVRWMRIGENIARGQPTPQAVHDAWMSSTGHRANILNPQFGRIGIGHVACPGSGPYWTQDFAD